MDKPDQIYNLKKIKRRKILSDNLAEIEFHVEKIEKTTEMMKEDFIGLPKDFLQSATFKQIDYYCSYLENFIAEMKITVAKSENELIYLRNLKIAEDN